MDLNMEKILEFINGLNFDEIITAITDFLEKIDLKKILDDIINFVSGIVK